MKRNVESQQAVIEENNVVIKLKIYFQFFSIHIIFLMLQATLILLLVEHKIENKGTVILAILLQTMLLCIVCNLNQSAAENEEYCTLSTRIRMFITGLRVFYVLLIVTGMGCLIYMTRIIDWS
ncbi:hypothetical protein CASFOL_020684 [Castilleja foliolosa]|uniref:Uncharacterized protein n=1 Tax=Castilleja foliolosa TaxID=1961234 RepID=A0ABD3D5U7_9LAMI